MFYLWLLGALLVGLALLSLSMKQKRYFPGQLSFVLYSFVRDDDAQKDLDLDVAHTGPTTWFGPIGTIMLSLKFLNSRHRWWLQLHEKLGFDAGFLAFFFRVNVVFFDVVSFVSASCLLLRGATQADRSAGSSRSNRLCRSNARGYEIRVDRERRSVV